MEELTRTDHFLFLILFVLFPLRARSRGFAELRRRIEAGEIALRRRLYRRGTIQYLALLALLLAFWWTEQRPWSGLGIRGVGELRFLIGFVLAAAVAAVFVLAARRSLGSAKGRERLRRRVRKLEFLLPQDRDELRASLPFFLSGSVYEEFLYRAYLLWYLSFAFSWPLALITQAVLFGLAHHYQGARGMVETGALGFLLGLLYLYTETVWLPISLHLFANMNSARVVL